MANANAADEHDALREPAWVRRTLIALAVLAMLALVVLPLARPVCRLMLPPPATLPVMAVLKV